MRTTLRLVSLCALVSLQAAGAGFRYREEVDGKAVQYTDVSKSAQGAIIQYPDDRFEIRTDPAGATISVEVGHASTRVVVAQVGTALRLSGGELLQELDGQPWHQSPFLLDAFVVSGAPELVFWTLTTSGEAARGGRSVDALKLIAHREGVERLKMNGVESDTVHVVLTVPGFRSLFWKAHYWYRPDGVLVRYEEPRGKKGTVHGALVSQTP